MESRASETACVAEGKLSTYVDCNGRQVIRGRSMGNAKAVSSGPGANLSIIWIIVSIYQAHGELFVSLFLWSQPL